MKSVITYFLIFFVFACSLQAQKIGYCNSESIIAAMPETKDADMQVESLRVQLRSQREEMVAHVQSEYARMERLFSGGCISPSAHRKLVAQFQKMLDDVGQFQKNMDLRIQNLETKLRKPILAKFNYAIEAVSEENGLDFIINQNMDIVLYAKETTDVSALVKSKLGI